MLGSLRGRCSGRVSLVAQPTTARVPGTVARSARWPYPRHWPTSSRISIGSGDPVVDQRDLPEAGLVGLCASVQPMSYEFRMAFADIDAVLIKSVGDVEATGIEGELHGEGAVRQVMT